MVSNWLTLSKINISFITYIPILHRVLVTQNSHKSKPFFSVFIFISWTRTKCYYFNNNMNTNQYVRKDMWAPLNNIQVKSDKY